MKFLAMAALLLSSTIAFAYPAVNDQAVFSGTQVSGPNTTPFTMTLELIQFDAANQQYLQRQTIAFGSQTQTQEQWMKTSQMLNPTAVAQIIAGCASQGGKLDSVVVGTTTLQACAMPVQNADEDSTYWIADVPFGIAKAQMNSKKDASVTSLTMTSHSGQ
jgi:hypothetical protein